MQVLYIHTGSVCVGIVGGEETQGIGWHTEAPRPSALALPLRQKGELQPLSPGAGLMSTDGVFSMDLVGHYLWQRP